VGSGESERVDWWKLLALWLVLAVLGGLATYVSVSVLLDLISKISGSAQDPVTGVVMTLLMIAWFLWFVLVNVNQEARSLSISM